MTHSFTRFPKLTSDNVAEPAITLVRLSIKGSSKHQVAVVVYCMACMSTTDGVRLSG
ncbi:hypothetical protein J6590_016718 [Homalodisca vitripennis]|nr:hypothetical protein J6590_016718 [Homalodisca vitripennis]